MQLSKLGRYELITRIGQGGMAEVQLAVQRGPAGFEKLVVVKLIHEKLAAEKTFVDMLLDEARVAALVKHPNVVDIYDLGEVDGRYFIAMEYLEGEPLLALLRAGREGTRLDPLSTARLIADTAEGLDAAHNLRTLAGEPLGLVHHDVSLGNIVVLYNGQVKLVDFGVARATEHAGPSLKVHGKISYMAPEKLRGQPGDRRSDIWSLGVVLWEALTLRRLFRGADERQTMQMVLDYPIPAPSAICKDVPADLDAIVMRALERDVEQRYGTAKELADDLDACLTSHSYGRTNRIAQFMQSTFGAHIVARRNLMREVATKGMPSADVLDAVFFADEKHSIPGEVSIRFKRKTLETPVRGTARRSIVTEVPVAEGTPVQSVDDVIERRKRNSFQMVAEGTPHSQVTPLPVHIERVDRPDTEIDPRQTGPAAVIHDAPLVEQPTAALSPELLDSLARKSARVHTPVVAEIEQAISETLEAQPEPPAEVVQEPARQGIGRSVVVGATVGVLAVVGILVAQYL